MKKSIIAIIAVVVITANTVLGAVIFAKLSNKESAKDKSVSNNVNSESSNQKVDGSTKSGQEVTLAAEGLKLTVPEGLDFKNEIVEWENFGSDTPIMTKSDNFILTSGKLKLLIITHPDGLGGSDPCHEQEQSNEFKATCRVLSSLDLVVFKQAKKMNLWEEISASGTVHSVKLSSADKVNDVNSRPLFTHTFKSETGNDHYNIISIAKSDNSDITIDDFKSDDMKKIISILESMRY